MHGPSACSWRRWRADLGEVAIEVADAFQQQGIGSALANLTIQRAHASGLTLLTATTLRENRAARGLLRQHGFRAGHSGYDAIDYELELGTGARDEPDHAAAIKEGSVRSGVLATSDGMTSDDCAGAIV